MVINQVVTLAINSALILGAVLMLGLSVFLLLEALSAVVLRVCVGLWAGVSGSRTAGRCDLC